MGPTSKYVPGNQVSRPVDGAGGRGEGDVDVDGGISPIPRSLPPSPKLAQIKTRRGGPSTESTSPRVPVGEQKPMPLLRFVILKQSTDQRVGVSFVAEDEDELEYGAQRPALHGAAFT